MANLANKTALVTGASRRMGRATALALAAAGARVIIHFGRNADEAKSVVDQIRAAGGRADAVAADLSAPDGAHELAAQVRNLIGDRLDILVANAGISTAATFEEHHGPRLRRSLRSQRPLALLPGATAAAILGRGQRRFPLVAWRARGCWRPFSIRRHQRCHRHSGQVFRGSARSPWHPRQRRGTGRN